MAMVTKAIADRTLEPSAIVDSGGDGTYPEDGSRKMTAVTMMMMGMGMRRQRGGEVP